VAVTREVKRKRKRHQEDINKVTKGHPCSKQKFSIFFSLFNNNILLK
jgi:hypothetical protein